MTSALLLEDDAFNGAVRLWTGWQRMFKEWIGQNGGTAEIVIPIQEFVPWVDAERDFHAPKTPRLPAWETGGAR